MSVTPYWYQWEKMPRCPQCGERFTGIQVQAHVNCETCQFLVAWQYCEPCGALGDEVWSTKGRTVRRSDVWTANG